MDINSYFPDEKEDDGPYARKGQFSQTIPGAPPERPAAVLNVSDSAQRDVTFRHQSLPPMNAGSVAVLPLSGKPAPNSLPGSHSLSPSPMQGFVPLIPSNGSATLRQSPSVPNLGVTSSGGFHKTHSRHSSLTGGTTFHPSHTRNASLGSVGMNDANAINAANADITPMPAPPPISHLSTSSSIRSNRAALRRVKPSFAPHPEQTPGQQNPQQPFFGYPQPQMQQSYGSAASNEFNAQTGVYNLEASYVPVDHHWFYCKKDPTGKEIWNPFSKKDSTLLEEAYIKAMDGIETKDKVHVMGNRYDVHICDRLCYPVYWSEEPYPVIRSGWFFRKHLESKFTPFDEAVSAKIEEEYRQCCLTNQWQRHVDIGNGEVVSLNACNSFIQYLHASTFYAENPPSPDTQGVLHHTNSVKRSIAECQKLPDDETEEVDHLVFLVHGIGSVCDFKFRPVVEVVNYIREISDTLLSNNFGNSIISGAVNRVEFLPVNWHDPLHGDETGIDQRLKPITLGSIPKLRHFANDTVLDVLFYTSPVYCETIVSTVVCELNRMYKLFIERNPGFGGKVSLGGHSLGSLILFDILSHQPVTSTKTDDAVNAPEDNQLDDPSIDDICKKLQMEDLLPIFVKEKLDYKTLLLCADSEFKDLGLTVGQRVRLKVYLRDVHRRRIRRKTEAGHEVRGYNCNWTSAGTGQPSIEYPTIEFETASFFAMGSPIAMFVAVRGIETLGPDFKFPSCPKMYNIFHPHDPIAYRVEPLIDPRMASIPPVLMPHHKGRKRFHREIQETVSKFTADIKQKFWDGLKTTISAVQSYTPISRIPAISNFVGSMEPTQKVDDPIQLQSGSSTSGLVKDAQDAFLDEGFAEFRGSDDPAIVNMHVGALNEGRRIDYVLQEGPLESVGEYVFAMASHVGYWQSEDTVLLILKEIYSDLGVSPDSIPAAEPQAQFQPNSAISISQSQAGIINAVPQYTPSAPRSHIALPSAQAFGPPRSVPLLPVAPEVSRSQTALNQNVGAVQNVPVLPPVPLAPRSQIIVNQNAGSLGTGGSSAGSAGTKVLDFKPPPTRVPQSSKASASNVNRQRKYVCALNRKPPSAQEGERSQPLPPPPMSGFTPLK
ncbi:phospholipase DDHD2-like isoform X2 [Artemia franciscana]|uniref:phospholipase DDHD2-like isoform X2 n=1 Tax=Artemia franciscana TaxID=6661 RepID=UPI0032DA8819